MITRGQIDAVALGFEQSHEIPYHGKRREAILDRLEDL